MFLQTFTYIDFMKWPGHSELLSELLTVLIIPASNVQPERIFSGLKQIYINLLEKLYVTSKMESIMIMNVQQEKA